eukprot:6202442-Pleurochrysis_carterae.AAC.1
MHACTWLMHLKIRALAACRQHARTPHSFVRAWATVRRATGGQMRRARVDAANACETACAGGGCTLSACMLHAAV